MKMSRSNFLFGSTAAMSLAGCNTVKMDFAHGTGHGISLKRDFCRNGYEAKDEMSAAYALADPFSR